MAKIKQAQFDEKYIWIGGGVLLLLLFIYASGRKAGKEDDSDPSDANPNVNAITVQNESGSISWNPSSLIKRIHVAYVVNNLDGRYEAINALADLQDAQLRHLATGYLEVYGTTLRKVLEGAPWFFKGDSDAMFMVLRRMDTLEIT